MLQTRLAVVLVATTMSPFVYSSPTSTLSSITTSINVPFVLGTIDILGIVAATLIFILARQNHDDTIEYDTRETDEALLALTNTTELPPVELQPVPVHGHPDDSGVPLPDFSENPSSPTVNTNLPPVDVNADVPIAPVPVLDAPIDSHVETVLIQGEADEQIIVDTNVEVPLEELADTHDNANNDKTTGHTDTH